jgi:hypothetical protein
MDIITLVEKELKNDSILRSPGLCVEYKAKLSGEYSFLCGQLEIILANKPSMWNSRRKDFKSDSACENWWLSTADGINETGLKLRLKRVEKLLQGLNGILRLAESESRNEL